MSIQRFLSSKLIIVAGASDNKQKFGNKVLCAFKSKTSIPLIGINPVLNEVEGTLCVKSIKDVIDLHPDICLEHIGLSIITPPHVTLDLTRQALHEGIKNYWIQPGAEHPEAVELINSMPDSNVLYCGPCVLVELDSLSFDSKL